MLKIQILIVLTTLLGLTGSSIAAADDAFATAKRNLLIMGVEAKLDRPVLSADFNESSALESTTPSEPDIVATFESASSWASGVNWSGTTFGGSIGLGKNFFGSNLADDAHVSVEIIFSNTDSTFAQTFRRDLSYPSSGVGVFPGTVWDVSNPGSPRRLNVCFAEDNNLAPANLSWDPNSSSYGNREYLFIMNSDYDGTGTTYSGFNINTGGSSMDVLYGWWPRISSGMSLMQTLPATLSIDAYYIKNFRGIPDSTSVILTWNWNKAGQSGFDIYSGSDPLSLTLLHSASASVRSYEHIGLAPGSTAYYKIDAHDGVPQIIGTSPTIAVTAAAVSSNLNLVGYLHNRGKYGDIWGYTDGGGHEYALICARDEGVSIIDLEVNPPTEVSFIPSLAPGNDAKDVKIYQNYAVIVKEYEEIQIVDISNILAPNQVSIWMPDGGGSHNCLVDGDYLYVVGNHGAGGLEIVDISNPAAPSEVGSFQPFYYHDIDIRNDTVVAAGIYSDGIDLIDVSNKTAPSLVSNWNYASSGAHNVEFSFDGKYVFQGDEIGGSGNHTRVWEISDPFNTSLASEIIVDPSAVVHNCYVWQDTLLVIGHYTEGVRVWNVKNPSAPFEVAYYDTYQPAAYGYLGCWSVYPYFASGKIIASDMQTGLYVLEADFPPPVICCDLAGDASNDGLVDIGDLTHFVDFLFNSGAVPDCQDEADFNGSNALDIEDLTARVDWMFSSGTGPICGSTGTK